MPRGAARPARGDTTSTGTVRRTAAAAAARAGSKRLAGVARQHRVDAHLDSLHRAIVSVSRGGAAQTSARLDRISSEAGTERPVTCHPIVRRLARSAPASSMIHSSVVLVSARSPGRPNRRCSASNRARPSCRPAGDVLGLASGSSRSATITDARAAPAPATPANAGPRTRPAELALFPPGAQALRQRRRARWRGGARRRPRPD